MRLKVYLSSQTRYSSQIKLVFRMAWVIEILKIHVKEQLQINYYMIDQLILLKILDMMDIKKV